jgi:tetratricopeptide (TPR) repeat protein
MSLWAEFSATEYEQFWNLAPHDRQQQLDDPQTPVALKALLFYQQGQHQREQADWHRAIAAFEDALNLKPGWYEIWTDHAAALLQVGEFESAIVSCDRALDLEPTTAKAWSIKGTALNKLHRYAAAANCCDRALELDANNHQAWRTLSHALKQLGRYAAAIVGYDKVLALQPADPTAWGERGLALQKLGRYEEAIASYDQQLISDSKNYHLWYQRGLALRRLGHPVEAIANFEQALELQPDFYPATRSKLFLLLTTGEWLNYYLVGRSINTAAKIQADLRNVLNAFVRTKLPALIVLALSALSTSHNRLFAIGIAAVFLVVTIASGLMAESRR